MVHDESRDGCLQASSSNVIAAKRKRAIDEAPPIMVKRLAHGMFNIPKTGILRLPQDQLDFISKFG